MSELNLTYGDELNTEQKELQSSSCRLKINERNIVVSIILSIITLGIYGLYWQYLLIENTHEIANDYRKCRREMICYIFVPFYSLYWWYTRGELIRKEFSLKDYKVSCNGVAFLLFSVFGLDIIAQTLMQNDFNSLPANIKVRNIRRSSQKELQSSSYRLKINERKVVVSIILSIITLGIYGLYWQYLLMQNTHEIAHEDRKCRREMICYIFVPFYSLYWWYTRGELIRNEFSHKGYKVGCNSVTLLLFSVFGLDIVAQTLMQKDFNSLPASIKVRDIRRSLRIEFIGTIMALPPFLGFLLFSFFPMGVSLGVSFTSLHSYNLSQAKWIGIQNYVDVFKDPMLKKSVINTLQWMLTVPITTVTAIILANAVAKNIPTSKFFRVIFFLPQICSTVAVTLMWQWMFNEYGILNTFFQSLGWKPIPWMSNSDYFMWAIVIIGVWKTGTNCIILEAAFANVDKSLQEAARVDGANDTKVFWNITLPQLTPTIFYLLTMNLIAAMQEQTIMQVLAAGLENGAGPGGKAVTLVYYIYRMVFNYRMTMGMGMSCALSWITAIIIMIITRINFWLSRFWVSYD